MFDGWGDKAALPAEAMCASDAVPCREKDGVADAHERHAEKGTQGSAWVGRVG